MTSSHHFRELALAVLDTEAHAIVLQKKNIDHSFDLACEQLLACKGRIILTGMGKSGHIARKIAATFASTGSPAFFIHAAEAIHGDLGMITKNDIIIALSYSGETYEVIALLPEIKRLGASTIGVTGNPQSSLGREADITITITIEKEACPLGLAPTASTTATLAMGDALAIALLDARGFTKQDFASSHPGGRLGKSLLHVADIMHSGDALPLVKGQDTLAHTLVLMSDKKFGTAIAVDESNKLLGIFTDGDLRRYLCQEGSHLNVQTPMHQIVRHGCKTIHQESMAEKALQIMEEMKITVLPVINDHREPIGVLHMHDLLHWRIK